MGEGKGKCREEKGPPFVGILAIGSYQRFSLQGRGR